MKESQEPATQGTLQLMMLRFWMALVHSQVCTIIHTDAADIIIFAASDSMRRKESTSDTMVTSGHPNLPTELTELIVLLPLLIALTLKH